jgi:hypothetical protein
LADGLAYQAKISFQQIIVLKNKLNKLIDFINNEYVDNINTDSIIDLTVNNIPGQLDPHSVYVPPAEHEVGRI